MLVMEPHERITVEYALEHPCLANLHSKTKAPICAEIFDDSFECCNVERLKEILFEEEVTSNLKAKNIL